MSKQLGSTTPRRHSKQCPDCPDGNEWASPGPTGRACKTCKGFGYVETTDLLPETKAALERYYAQELEPQDDADFGHAMGLDGSDQ